MHINHPHPIFKKQKQFLKMLKNCLRVEREMTPPVASHSARCTASFGCKHTESVSSGKDLLSKQNIVRAISH